MNACAFAVVAAALTASSVAAATPYAMFSLTDAAKSTGSCATNATCFLHHAGSRAVSFSPSTVSAPAVGS